MFSKFQFFFTPYIKCFNNTFRLRKINKIKEENQKNLNKLTPLRLSIVFKVAKPISLFVSPGNINSSFSISFSN